MAYMQMEHFFIRTRRLPNLQWSIDFETEVPDYSEFLFATGDIEIWLMTTKAEVMEYCHNEQGGIIKSSNIDLNRQGDTCAHIPLKIHGYLSLITGMHF